MEKKKKYHQMEAKITQASDDPTPTPQAFHAHFHTGRRLRKLLRPNGRRVHIATTPEEHIHLKRYVHLKIQISPYESPRHVERSHGRQYPTSTPHLRKHSDNKIPCAVLCQTLNQMKTSIVTSMGRQNT